MEYYQEIRVPQATLEQISTYLTVEPTSRNEHLDEDETIIYTANFGNGIEMDVKCCGVQWNDYTDEDIEYGETNTAWSEAVLFDNGSEVACEYGEDDFSGEWRMEYDGDVYIANIVAE